MHGSVAEAFASSILLSCIVSPEADNGGDWAPLEPARLLIKMPRTLPYCLRGQRRIPTAQHKLLGATLSLALLKAICSPTIRDGCQSEPAPGGSLAKSRLGERKDHQNPRNKAGPVATKFLTFLEVCGQRSKLEKNLSAPLPWQEGLRDKSP